MNENLKTVGQNLMKGNTNVKSARELAGDSGIKHATLALAHEQRISNLIAYLNWADTHNVSMSISRYKAIQGQIEAGMGIDGDL